MVCMICFDVLVLIKFLKPDRFSHEVTKLINNPDVTYETFHWLKLVRPFVTQKCLDSNAIYIRKELLLDPAVARNPGSMLFTERNGPKLYRKSSFKKKDSTCIS